MNEDGPRSDQEPNIVEVLVKDPLTEVTRKERVYLLAVSLIGIAIVTTGLVPSRIAALGIVLDQPDRAALLILLAVVTAYFLVAFVVYAASDYVTRRTILELVTARMREQRIGQTEVQSSQKNLETSETSEETEPRRSAPERTRAGRTPWDLIARSAVTTFLNLQRGTILMYGPLREMIVLLGTPALPQLLDERELSQLGASKSSQIVAGIRLFFEFVVPILVGIVAVVALLVGAADPPGPS